jgi:hypothetical protein
MVAQGGDPETAHGSLTGIQADKPVRDGLHTRWFDRLALVEPNKILSLRQIGRRGSPAVIKLVKWRSKPSERGCKDPLYWAGNRSLESLPTVAEIGPKSTNFERFLTPSQRRD